MVAKESQLQTGEAVVAAGTARVSSVRWLAILATLGMAGHGLGQTVMGPVVAEVMTEYGVRETAVGVLLAAGSLGFMVGCLAGGFVVDRVGLKPTLLAAWGLVMVSLFALVSAPVFAMVLACYFLFGVASGFVETGLNVLPTQIGGGAWMMNLVHMGFGVGALAAPLLVAALLRSGAGWRGGFLLVVALAALTLVLGLGSQLPEAPGRRPASEGTPLLRLARHRLVVMGGLALFFYVGGEMGVNAWSVLSMQERFGLDALGAGTALSLFWAAMLAARLVQGAIVARFSIPSVVTVSGVISALGIFAFTLATTPAQAYAAAMVAGLAAGGMYPNVMVYVNGRFPRQIGAVTGILSTVAVGGTFVLQPVVGRVAETAGLQVGVLLVAASMLVSSVLLLAVWLRDRGAASPAH